MNTTAAVQAEAEDVVQHAWLRLHRNQAEIENLPARLTTVTTRLRLDRLQARIPVPSAETGPAATVPGPADDVVLADAVGAALQLVLDRLSPRERVPFVMHGSFGVEFPTIATVLDTTPVAAPEPVSRARAEVGRSAPGGRPTAWEVVAAFTAAAGEGDCERLLRRLAPDAAVTAGDAAKSAGTPEKLTGRGQVAACLNGSTHAALPVFVGDRPAAAWFHRDKGPVRLHRRRRPGRPHRLPRRTRGAGPRGAPRR